MQSMKWFKAVVSETFAGVDLPLGAEVYSAKIERYGTDRDDVLIVWPEGQMTMSVTSAQQHLILDKSRSLIGGPFGPQEGAQEVPRKASKPRRRKRSTDRQSVASKPNRKHARVNQRRFDSGFTEGSAKDLAIQQLIIDGVDLGEIVECPRCGGSGVYGHHGMCYCCKGRGKVTQAARALHFVGVAEAASA